MFFPSFFLDFYYKSGVVLITLFTLLIKELNDTKIFGVLNNL